MVSSSAKLATDCGRKMGEQGSKKQESKRAGEQESKRERETEIKSNRAGSVGEGEGPGTRPFRSYCFSYNTLKEKKNLARKGYPT